MTTGGGGHVVSSFSSWAIAYGPVSQRAPTVFPAQRRQRVTAIGRARGVAEQQFRISQVGGELPYDGSQPRAMGSAGSEE